MAPPLVFLEFPDEVNAYLAGERPSDHPSTSATLIALSPPTQAHLQRLGRAAQNTLPYFNNTSHANALKKSEKLMQWIRGHAEFEDNWGIRTAYVERLVWHARLVVHHCLWTLEILQNAVNQHNAEKLHACFPTRMEVSGTMIGPAERYFGILAKSFAAMRGLEFGPIVLDAGEPPKKRAEVFIRRLELLLASKVIGPLAAASHRNQLRRLRLQRPILFTTKSYRMGALAARIRREREGIVSILLHADGAGRSWTALVNSRSTPPFDSEARLAFLEPFVEENEDSRRRLEDMLERFVRSVRAAPDIFSHLGVSFADIVAQKVQYGISPSLLTLHRRAVVLRFLLGLLHPSLVMSAGDCADDMLIGELCHLGGFPALLISHGSHVPPKNDLERIEWGEHGQPLLRALYPSVAVQSPLAEEFLKAFPSKSLAIRTGPLLWGSPVNRERSAFLLRQMVGRHPPQNVIVHAGSYKPRQSIRLQVFETADEYIRSIRELASAVESLQGACLIVQFQASPDLSVDDLKTLVPFSEKVILSVGKPFLDVLGFADLLVSFSSTTIEEALQNHVPVLLYGGGGRYQHVPGAVPVTCDVPVPLAAAYFVERAEDLANALARILEAYATTRAEPNLFAPFRIPPEACVSLATFLDGTARLTPSASRAG